MLTQSGNRTLKLVAVLWLIATLAWLTLPGAFAQENVPAKPLDIPCASGLSVQVLGATPVGDGAQTLVMARVIFEPGGTIGVHTHPGTLVLTVESGRFGFTMVDEGTMMVNRAATADAEAGSEEMATSELTTLEPGDWLIEHGMLHTGENLSDGVTTVLLSGLIETGKPLTSCVEDASSTPTDERLLED